MKKLIFILTLCLVIGCQLSVVSSAQAAIPHLISYQGRLTNTEGAPVADGAYSITFRLYSSSAGGSALWYNTRSVTVSDGIFEVLLGEGKALDLPFDTQYYLGIQVGSDPEMTPRQKLSSSGYAFNAKTAEDAAKVGGIEASATSEADKLVALDVDGKLPLSALKTWDTGWFYVQGGQSYTRPHNLGTQKVIWQIYFATDSSGSNMEKVDFGRGPNGTPHGAVVYAITTTSVSVKTASYITVGDNLGLPSYSYGYYCLIGIVVE